MSSQRGGVSAAGFVWLGPLLLAVILGAVVGGAWGSDWGAAVGLGCVFVTSLVSAAVLAARYWRDMDL